MGPRTVFDKSALQALTIDESVWFNAFMSGIITPLFYVETLSDLSKPARAGTSPNKVVSLLAEKTPANAVPNIYHRTLILAELGGEKIEMDTRPLITGGKPKKTTEGKISVEVDGFVETDTLNRWREQKFIEIERDLATKWRSEVASFDASSIIGIVKNVIPTDTKISDLSALKLFIDNFCATSDENVLPLMLQVLDVPTEYHGQIIDGWKESGKPLINDYLPYTTHVFKVDLLYFLGIHRGFISGDRPSNKSDMAYLYYLPFCQVFISGDNLHSRTAPLFLNANQMYLRTDQLKSSLQEFDAYFDNYPDEIKQLGVMQFAGYPPHSINNSVTGVWDKLMRPDWRTISKEQEKDVGKPRDREKDKEFIADLERQMKEAETLDPSAVNPSKRQSEPDMIVLKRTVPSRKGKWRIVSREVEDMANKEQKDGK